MGLKEKEDFKIRVRDWAKKLDVQVRTITIRSMKNKWASCSRSGNLTFDSGLLSNGSREWDYVIVHELLHFSVPNHGRLWKSLMLAHLGDYDRIENKLSSSRGAIDQKVPNRE
ncbi:MAG: M48 family metallopeptidase [Deltaproteobacteria bacterium]|nr:M48 family metallopeptidase [Deltaproteobacteria bacterium]